MPEKLKTAERCLHAGVHRFKSWQGQTEVVSTNTLGSVVIGHWTVIDYPFEEKSALDSNIEASSYQTPQANKFSAD